MLDLLAVIIIVALGALAIVAFLEQYPQFGIVFVAPAVVMTYALIFDVNLSGIALVVLGLLWMLALLAAVFLRVPADLVVATMAFFAMVALLLLPLSWVTATSKNTVASPTQTSTTDSNVGGKRAMKLADQGTGTTPESCEAKFKQKWDPNKDFRFASNGLWDDPATHKVTAEGAAESQKALAARDARYLAGTAWSIALWDDPNKVAPLLTHDKTCLSKEGLALYDRLVAKWDSAKAEITQAPANGVNTGSHDGKYVASGSGGITGDKTALKRTYADGSVSYDLVRCANNVLPHRPRHVPPGKTDNPPPPKKHTPKPKPTPSHPTKTPTVTPTPTPTPTPTCPPDQTGTPPDCLEKKKGPVPYPPDKPRNPSPPGTPEETPPVETTPADPNTHPGDEDPNIPAPDSTPEPTQEPKPEPEPTVAPEPSSPGTHIPDPDGGDSEAGAQSADSTSTPSSAAVMGAFALPLGLMGWGLRRREKKATARR